MSRGESQDKPDNKVHIALLSLYRCGSANERVHLEDVAIECYRQMPSEFSWTRYPEFPDHESTRRELSRAKDRKLAAADRSGKWWMLTAEGVKSIKARMEQCALLASKQRLPSSRQDRQKALNDISKHPAFERFARTATRTQIERYELAEILRCPVDSSDRTFVERFAAVKSRASDADRDDILEFLRFCERKFPDLLSGA